MENGSIEKTPLPWEMNIKERLVSYHNQIFGEVDMVIASPGRVNIIGEHTDYNQGLVLPYALNKHIYMAASPSQEPELKVYSADLKRYVDFSLKEGRPSWCRYFDQVIKYFAQEYGPVPGLEITMLSDLPVGAGISSSSALTCGVIFLYDHYMNMALDNDKMIQIATFTEHGIGLIGGAMDQSTILKAKEDQALLMDFGNKTEEYIPLKMDGHEFYLVYSDVEHTLVDSEYNTRREECEESVNLICKNYKEIPHLSALDIEDLPALELPQPLKKRTEFVVEENHRVREAVSLLKNGMIGEIGDMINGSHEGLSSKYEVSTSEIDWLVSHLQAEKMVVGARMIGGGFGGSILVLLNGDDSSVIESVIDLYNKKYSKKAFYFNAHSGPALQKV